MDQVRGRSRYAGELSEGQERWFEILGVYERKPENLIPILQSTQRALGYLPEWALLDISDHIGLPSAKVFGVASFYGQFRLHPIGSHVIRICRGTACHVRGSHRILKEIQARLKVTPGATTKDRFFTLQTTVGCFGPCALAPVMIVDDRVYGRMTPSKAMAILDEFRETRKQELPGDHRIQGSGG